MSTDAAVKAKAVRARAMVALHLGRIAEARKLLDTADDFAPPADRIARTLLERAEKGADAALLLLGTASSAREIEIKASLLLELGRPADAKQILKDASSEGNAAERLRIRAIAECMLGHRTVSIDLARQAREKDPLSAGIQQTLGVLHVMAALSGHAELQFGSVPNPFNLGLVKGARETHEHLNAAIAVFDSLAPTVQPPLQGDVELWKLASLIAHEGRRQDARQFASQLLRRSSPQPLAIAWCRLAGLPVQIGKMRKALEDALRQGLGSPSHVVVSALLASDRDGPEAGADVIKRHMSLFPEAADFLDAWRKKIAGQKSGEPFADAMQTAIEQRDYAPLTAALNDSALSDDDVLAAAMVFAFRGEWPALNSMEKRLLALATPRAIELAAQAAKRCGKPTDVLRILDNNLNVFFDGKLPAGLQYIRAQANEVLGRKHHALADLEAIAVATEDANVHLQLIRSHMAIGNLAAVRQHAEIYFQNPGAQAADLVGVAQAIKRADPIFARTLVEKAAADPKLPKALAPTMLTLAMEFGIGEIEMHMMQIVSNVAKYGKATGVTTLTVDEILAFAKECGEEIRREFSEWLQGQKPTHILLRSDLDTFAKLFLGEGPDRVNSVGDHFPMLLRAGGIATKSFIKGTQKPLLRIDITALLLASRLGLLETIDAVFDVQIPESLPLVLTEMEAELPQPSQAVIDALKSLLGADNTALEIVEAPPSDALSLDHPERPGQLNPDLLHAVIRHALLQGALPQKVATDALTALDLPDVPGIQATTPVSLLLSPHSVARLAGVQLLEPIARAIPTYLTRRDRARLRKDIASEERSLQRWKHIRDLRETVAARIQLGQWNTLPRLDWKARRQNPGRIPPHVRCLIEMISAAEHPNGDFLWIEDRAISRSGHPQLLSIVEVLAFLEQLGVLAAERRQAVTEELRALGYAYLPPDHVAFANTVCVAPIQADALVETPELEALRVWFAGEIDRARYLDFRPVPDEDGHVGGEARHLLAVLGTAREVLRHIWNNTQLSHEDKQIRSSWVWMCLRADQADYLPRQNDNADGRLNVMATLFAHIGITPFLDVARSNGASQDAGKPFLEWFFRTVIDQTCWNDERLKLRLEKALADLLTSTLERPASAPEGATEQQVRSYFIVEARRYLDLLPNGWRARIVRHHGLESKLNIATTLVVNAGEGTEIAVGDFSSAVAQGIDTLASNEVTSILLKTVRGGKVQLNLRKSANAIPTAELVHGDTTTPIDAVMVALAHPSASIRLAALSDVHDLYDASPATRQRRTHEIAALDDPVERARCFHTFYAKNLERRLRNVRAKLETEQRVDLSDLELPDPDMIAAHLRLGDPRELPSEIASKIAAGLAELPPLTAASRCASHPFQLPAELLNRIGAAAIAIRTANPSRRPRPSSPLHALLILRALCTAGDAPDNLITDAAQDVLGFSSTFLDLFAAFISHGAKTAARSPDWIALTDEVALALLWAWADLMTSAFAMAGVQPAEAAKLIRNLTPASLIDAWPTGPRQPWYHAWSSELSAIRLRAAITAAAIEASHASRIPPSILDQMRQPLGHDGTKGWIPRPELFFPPPEAPLGLWVGRDPLLSFAATDWLKPESEFATRDPRKLVRIMLDAEPNSEHPYVIPFLLSFAPLERLDQSLIDEILVGLQAMEVTPDKIVGDPSVQLVLMQQARILGHKQDDVAQLAIIADWSSKFAKQFPRTSLDYRALSDEGEAVNVFTWLIENLLAYAQAMPGTLSQKMHFIAIGTEVIASNWPSTLRGAIAFLNDCTRLVDVQSAREIWPTLLSLRSRS